MLVSLLNRVFELEVRGRYRLGLRVFDNRMGAARQPVRGLGGFAFGAVCHFGFAFVCDVGFGLNIYSDTFVLCPLV